MKTLTFTLVNKESGNKQMNKHCLVIVSPLFGQHVDLGIQSFVTDYRLGLLKKVSLC